MSRLAPLIGAAILAAACAHRADMPVDGLDFDERQARLAAVPAWDLQGQLAIDTGEDRYPTSVRWRQRAGLIDMTVRGRVPGTGSFQVTGNRERLTLTSRGDTEVLTDPEAQLSAMFGWWLPVTSLEHWLLGGPDPGFDSRVVRGREGTLSALQQREWHIAYEEYQLAEGLLLPRRLTLTHSSLELRLSVTNWETAVLEP